MKLIREIEGRIVDMTNEEFAYYSSLAKKFGKDVFRDLFESDAGGRIITLTPSAEKPTAILVIFFFLNLMLNQRLRAIDYKLSKIDELEKRISKLEG